MRESTSVTDSLVLTVLAADGTLAHLRLQHSPRGYLLQGDSMYFTSIKRLITHYSNEVMPGMRGLRLGQCCLGEQLYESI